MQITRKIMPYVIAGAGVLGAAGIYANHQAKVQEHEENQKIEALFQHKLDSVMKVDKIDALQAGARVNSEVVEDCNKLLTQIVYEVECEKRGLDSRLPRTKEDLEAIKKQEQKIDSIENEIESVKTENFCNSLGSSEKETSKLLGEILKMVQQK